MQEFLHEKKKSKVAQPCFQRHHCKPGHRGQKCKAIRKVPVLSRGGQKEAGVGLGCVYSGLWEFLWVLGLPGLGSNMGVQLGLLLGSSSELRMLPVSHLAVLSSSLVGPGPLARPHLEKEGREPGTESSNGSQ